MAKSDLERRMGRELRDQTGRRIPPYLHRYCQKRHSPSGRIYYVTPDQLRFERRRRYGK